MSDLNLAHGRLLSTSLYRAIQVTGSTQEEVFTRLANLASDNNPDGQLFFESLNLTFNDEYGTTEPYEVTGLVCL